MELLVHPAQREPDGSQAVASSLAAEVVDWIIEVTCKDRSCGARPLRRAIQRYVEDPLSEELIRGHLHRRRNRRLLWTPARSRTGRGSLHDCVGGRKLA